MATSKTRRVVAFVPTAETIEADKNHQYKLKDKLLTAAMKPVTPAMKEMNGEVLKVKYVNGDGSDARVLELTKKYPDVDKFIFRGFQPKKLNFL